MPHELINIKKKSFDIDFIWLQEFELTENQARVMLISS